MQKPAAARFEPLRFDDVREKRVHGSAAAFLQDRQSQTFRGNRFLSLQVSLIDTTNSIVLSLFSIFIILTP